VKKRTLRINRNCNDTESSKSRLIKINKTNKENIKIKRDIPLVSDIYNERRKYSRLDYITNQKRIDSRAQ
jgi:phosphoenolpyruvate synthase/pyruvate phosphate dikinase